VKHSSNNLSSRIFKQARQTLEIESEAISSLIPTLNGDFLKVIRLILSCKGRIIVTAIGKSGHIGRKITSTLVSTGTPASFLHPSEALHGDLGMITGKDIILVLSNSGESEEIINLVPIIKKIGAKIISITSRRDSTLARLSHVVLEVRVKQEADPLNLAPTASTTAALALGDTIAVVLLNERKFSPRDFAKLHPGGNIGRSLLEVKDIMHRGDANPVIDEGQTLKEALFLITSKGLGVVNVINQKGCLSGIITDGDVRRLFMNADTRLDELFSTPVKNVMIKKPITVFPGTLCMDAVRIMEDNRKHRLIYVLPVVDSKNHPVGVIHIHDLIRRGFSVNRDNKLDDETN